MFYMALFLTLLQFHSAVSTQTFFKKMLADAGIGIHCPSGNKVYLNPITNDLQQCSQQLGSYNETSCPGGTVCERFPILIPGFQDFCCWNNDSNGGDRRKGKKESSESSIEEKRHIIVTVTEHPELPERGIIDGDGDLPDIPEEAIAIIPEERGIRVTNSNEESEWEIDDRTTTRRTKRPRSRKIPTTTTTTTTEEPTTKRSSSSRRLPKCQNPDDNPLIDFGNKLRDCYFQQCYRGFRCEYNKEIRRFICCGQAAEPVQPAGLPPIPAPKPLMPRRFRPGPQGPGGPFNEGDIDGILPASSARFECENSNGPNCMNQQKGNINNQQNSWNENGCPNNGGGPNDMCNNNNGRNGPPGFVNNGQMNGPVNQGQGNWNGDGNNNKGQNNWNGDGNSNQGAQSNWNSDGCNTNGGGSGCGWQGNTATPTPMLPNNPNTAPNSFSNQNQNTGGNWNNMEQGNYNKNGNMQENQNNNWNNREVGDNQNLQGGRINSYPQNQNNNNWNQGSGNGNMENSGNYNENYEHGNWNNGGNNNMNGEPSPMNQMNNWNQGSQGSGSNVNGMDNMDSRGNYEENKNPNWNNGNGNSDNGNNGANQNGNWNQGSTQMNGGVPGYNTQGPPNKADNWNQSNGKGMNGPADWQNGNIDYNDYDNGKNTRNGGENMINNYNQGGTTGSYNGAYNSQTREAPNIAGPQSFKSYPKGTGSNKKQTRPAPLNDSCAAGFEYSIAGTVPKCAPPGSDSCPLSHPRCKISATLGHFVCCSAYGFD